MCANTKSRSPYFYITPAVHKNRYKQIRYITLLHIHGHYSNWPSKDITPTHTKKLEPGPWWCFLKKGCVHDRRVKNDNHHPPKKFKNAKDPFIQSSNSIEFYWSEVLRGKMPQRFPFCNMKRGKATQSLEDSRTLQDITGPQQEIWWR